MNTLKLKAGDLARELTAVQRVIARKETIPVLQYAKCETVDGKCVVTATDLDVVMRTIVPSTDLLQTPVLLPVGRLLETVKLLPSTSDVEISEEGGEGQLKVRSSGYEGTFRSLLATEFVIVPSIDPGLAAPVLPAKRLASLLRLGAYAAAAEQDARYSLQGGAFKIEGGVASLSSSDSHRLAHATCPGPSDVSLEIIIGLKALRELEWMAGEAEGDVVIVDGESHLFFTFGDRVLISRKVDGKFPQVANVIPTSYDSKCEFNREEAILSVQRVKIVSEDTQKGVAFRLGPKSLDDSAVLTLSASGDTAGRAQERIVGTRVDTGEEKLTGFNAQYMLDSLSAFTGEKFTVELPEDPMQGKVVFRSVPPADEPAALCVIMPMRGAAK